MGVKGLWQLISPTATPILLDSLDGKVLAVDVAIWLNKAAKGMRDGNGYQVFNAHLVLMFHRICKLLFYGIKPIIVFDGGVPELKKETIRYRLNRKRSAEASIKKAKDGIIKKYLQTKALGTMDNSGRDIKLKIGDGKKEPDLFGLPESRKSESESSEDESLVDEWTLRRQMAQVLSKCPDDLDIHSNAFAFLPSEVRYELLLDMQDVHRKSYKRKYKKGSGSSKERHRNNSLPMESSSFSEKQLQDFKVRGMITHKLDRLKKEMTDRMTTDFLDEEDYKKFQPRKNSLELKKVQSDGQKRIVYIKHQKSKEENILFCSSLDNLYSLSKQRDDVMKGAFCKLERDQAKFESVNSYDPSIMKEHSLEDVDSDVEETSVKVDVDSDVEETSVKVVNPQLQTNSVTLSSDDSSDEEVDWIDIKDSEKVDPQKLSIPEGIASVGKKSSQFERIPVSGSRINLSQNAIALKNRTKTVININENQSGSSQPKLLPNDIINVDEEKHDSSNTTEIKETNQRENRSEHLLNVITILDEPKQVLSNTPERQQKDQIENPLKQEDESELICNNLSQVEDLKEVDKTEQKMDIGVEEKEDCQSNSIHLLDKIKEDIIENEDNNLLEQASTINNSSKIEVKENTPLEKVLLPKDSAIQEQAIFHDSLSKDEGQVESTSSVSNDDGNRVETEVLPACKLDNDVEKIDQVDKNDTEAEMLPASKLDSNVDINVMETELLPETKLVGNTDKNFMEAEMLPQSKLGEMADKNDAEPEMLPSPKLGDITDKDDSEAENLSSPKIGENVDKNKMETEMLLDCELSDEGDKMMGEIDFVTHPMDSNCSELISALAKDKSKENLQAVRNQLIDEQMEMHSQSIKEKRQAATLTKEMYDDVKELLRIFGIPFLISPMEAEAQCAQLEIMKLTDGSITDDGDVFLFGGQTVYKNIFNAKNSAEKYEVKYLSSVLNLSREKLIALAFLTGSDYTVGINGVGYVTAMEILHSFGDIEPSETLFEFRAWVKDLNEGIETSSIPISKMKSKFKDIEIPYNFNADAVWEAYLKPEVDESDERFTWGSPMEEDLKDFAKEKLGWSTPHIKDVLDPVFMRLNERKKTQKTIDRYFVPQVQLKGNHAIKSKRLQRLLVKPRDEATTVTENKSPGKKSQLKTPTKKKLDQPTSSVTSSPSPQPKKKLNLMNSDIMDTKPVPRFVRMNMMNKLVKNRLKGKGKTNAKKNVRQKRTSAPVGNSVVSSDAPKPLLSSESDSD